MLLAIAICAGPLWLWYSPIQSYFLKGDDFVYLARSRTGASVREHLFEPHNGHVVPLFRLETYVLARLAGSLAAVPRSFAFASCCTLLAAMAVAGHIVARETGRAPLGLAAMAAVGFSTVLGPAILWYSAGQALAAGVAILITMAFLQAWRSRRSLSLLFLGTLAAAAAPLFWTAGYTAGLVGLVYLWSDGRRASRLASALPIAGSAMTGLLAWIFAGPALPATNELSRQSSNALANVSAISSHTTQAICEALVLSNLGLEAATSAVQSVVLLGILVAAWLWSRHEATPASRWPHWRLNPLETAGATLIITNYGLVFAARGLGMNYDKLRALGWYDAIPQLGAVLFASGWWSGQIDSPPPRRLNRPNCRELVGVALFAAIMLLMQVPRANRVIFQFDGAAAEISAGTGPTVPHTRSELAERARGQRAALAELDHVERSARDPKADIDKLLQKAALLEIPGMRMDLKEFTTADLLDLSELGVDNSLRRKP
jgi:hypothetical protein